MAFGARKTGAGTRFNGSSTHVEADVAPMHHSATRDMAKPTTPLNMAATIKPASASCGADNTPGKSPVKKHATVMSGRPTKAL